MSCPQPDFHCKCIPVNVILACFYKLIDKLNLCPVVINSMPTHFKHRTFLAQKVAKMLVIFNNLAISEPHKYYSCRFLRNEG